MNCNNIFFRHILFLSIVLFSHGLSAQSTITQTVKGVVTDQEIGYPLIGVNVSMNGDQLLGTSTDDNGRFRLENVPIGRQTFVISYIGYKTATLQNILVNSAKEVVLEVALEENLVTLDEVVVRANADQRTAQNDMAAVSARSMSIDEVQRFSGTFGDVARMAQNYAGVSGASDDRNDVIVRGNSPTSVLWRIEGVDVPSPNHWSTLGTTGGPISMLNTNILRNSDFLSGAFPAEYGNATGAVFDLNLRNGNTDKFEFLGQIGFNGFEGGVEGPLGLGVNSSFIANYRYSTLGVFQALGVDFGTGSATPQYQDLNFKINLPVSSKSIFSAWGLWGKSDIAFLTEPDESNLFQPGDENLYSMANTGIFGINHLALINETTSSKIALSYSTTNSDNILEEPTEDGINFQNIFSSRTGQEKLGINWTFNKKFSASTRLKAGAIYDHYNLSVKDSAWVNDSFWFLETDFEGNTSLIRSFATLQHKFNAKLTANVGLHAATFSLNNAFSLEPRLNIKYQLSDRSVVAFGYGRHSQTQPLPIYFAKRRNATDEENRANSLLDFIRSDQFVLSFDHQLSAKTSIKSEVYYQSLFDVAVDSKPSHFSMVNFGADFGFPNRVGLVNEGTARNYGLELTLEQNLNRGFYYLVTGSIFDSKYTGADNVERNTFFNSNYVFNVLLGKEVKLNDRFSLTFDGRMNFAGGRRYTPIDLEASIAAGDEVRNNELAFSEKYAPYFKPDLKFGFRHNAKKYTQTFSVDLQNFVGRRNVFSTRYNETKQQITTTYQRGFFPDVRYQILF